jgi:hypothetical protein
MTGLVLTGSAHPRPPRGQGVDHHHSNCQATNKEMIASPIQSTGLSRASGPGVLCAALSAVHESSFSVRLRKKPSAANSANKQAKTVNMANGADVSDAALKVV